MTRSFLHLLLASTLSLACAKGDGEIIGGGADVPVSGDAPVRDKPTGFDDISVVDDLPAPDDTPPPPPPPPEDVPPPPEDVAPPPPPPPEDVPPPPPPPEDVGLMCGGDQLACGGTCVSIQTDAMNCGRCGNACAAGQSCTAGVCRSMCATGQTACPSGAGFVCANLQSDGTHCGRCGNACGAGQTCATGTCRSTCPAGQTMCAGGSCADLQSDSANCGACGTACGMGQSCQAGRCTCPAGQAACAGRCVDIQGDNTNCGACGRVCAAGQSCQAGRCACPSGQTLCGTTCIDTQTDTAHCGACGTTCVAGQRCLAGRCACPTGQMLCGGRCVDTQSSTTHCGACNTACAAGQTCAAGRCACPTGQSLCAGRCVNLQSDNAHCGACGMACAAPRSCAMGTCTCNCPAGQSCCGAACVNLQTSATHCGMCNRACASGTTCRAGACAPNNDDRASATSLTLTAGELTVMGSTVGATFDGPTTCTSAAPNVWYRFTLTQRELVYVDTAGSAYDTRLYLVDAAGAVVTGTCSDDVPCSAGGFTSTLQSRFAVVLNAGTYHVAVSGFTTSSTGAFTLHLQHIPASYGSNFIAAPIAGTGSAMGTLAGTGVRTPTCTIGPSAEDVRWFMTCGSTTASLLSLCMADGGTFLRQSGSTLYDPVVYVYSGATGTQTQCNDDGPSGTNCQGTGGNTLNYGSRISAPFARGVHAAVVDDRTQPRGMTYTLRYQLQ